MSVLNGFYSISFTGTVAKWVWRALKDVFFKQARGDATQRRSVF
ncbi:hypothetical protein [Bartonella sp. AU16XJBT]|nr:hypothetical protein [Bartonella sp. AU16XJBT]